MLAVRGLFVFVGAQPATGWLAGQLAEDAHGFLLTQGENVVRGESMTMDMTTGVAKVEPRKGGRLDMIMMPPSSLTVVVVFASPA